MYYKIINDRMVFNSGKTIQLEYDHPPLVKGQWVSNPDESLILADGWQVYVPPIVPPQPQTEPGYEEIVNAVKKMLSTDTNELTDEEALEVAALFPTWASKLPNDGKPAVPVVAGERLWYDGKLYKVLQPHTPQSEWTPDTATSLYAEVSIEEIPDWTPRTAENAFMTGDKCKHNGRVWESLIDNNVWEPGTIGTENLWHIV